MKTIYMVHYPDCLGYPQVYTCNTAQEAKCFADGLMTDIYDVDPKRKQYTILTKRISDITGEEME